MTAPQVFPKSRRLLKTDEFSSVFHFKCWVKGKHFRVLARPNRLSFPRLGVVASKKICPHAVHRNRVKRTAREAFRTNQPALAGLDVVVQLYAPFHPAEKGAVRQELDGLLVEIRKCLGS